MQPNPLRSLRSRPAPSLDPAGRLPDVSCRLRADSRARQISRGESRSSSSAAALRSPPPAAAWPDDDWWRAYGDPQLDGLIEEALRDSPNLAIAQARLRQAGAMTQMAGAPLMPEVTGNAAFNEAKQSYNYLMPRAGRAERLERLRPGDAESFLGTGFLGQEPLGPGSGDVGATGGRGRGGANPPDPVDLGGLGLRRTGPSVYRPRYRRGGAGLAHARRSSCSASVTNSVWRTWPACARSRHDRRRRKRQLLAIDERIALQRNGIAALLGAGPDRGLAITRPTVHFAGNTGLPPNLALELLGRRPDIVAARLRTEAAAKRIDQQKAGFYPSVNLMAFVGVQSLGIDKLTKSGSDIGSVGPAISLPIFNTERLQGQLRGAHAEYDAAVSTYNATLSNALREVADAATSRKSLDGELAASRAAVTAAAEAHRIVSDRYQGELATYLDVLTAEDQLISAQRALADIETRALVLDVALVRALGGGFQSRRQAERQTRHPRLNKAINRRKRNEPSQIECFAHRN